MLYYVPSTVSKTTCIGNSLSTINIGFSSLDTGLKTLSTYAVDSINFLSSTMISVSSTLANRIDFLSSTMISVSSTLANRIDFLSSSMISVSSTLANRVDFLSASINYLSANLVDNYYNPDVVYHAPSGAVIWDASLTRNNVNLVLSSNCYFPNPTNMLSGQQGNISIMSSGTSGYSITAFDDKWKFANSDTAMTVNLPNPRNLIRYYYDGSVILSEMLRF